MSDHAKYSPSRMERIITCAGSVVLEGREQDKPSKYAAEGNVAHDVGELVVKARITGDGPTDAAAYIGRQFTVDGFDFTVTEDMARHVNDYADSIEQMTGALAECSDCVFVEERVYFHRYVGCAKEEGFGTSDLIFLDYPAKTIRIRDLKYGMGVRVWAEENSQGMTYALGVLDRFSLVEDWEAVEISIHQPRLDHLDSWTCSVERLHEFAEELAAGIEKVRAAEAVTNGDYTAFLSPGEKACRFCKAKANCPALRDAVSNTVGETIGVSDFDDLTTTNIPEVVTKFATAEYLGRAMDLVPLIELWAAAVRAEVERRVFAGEAVDSPLGGYGLGEGKKGNRAWVDAEAVEQKLKSARLRHEEVFDYSLISPTTAEKRLKKDKPRVWAGLAELIHQKPGKPSVQLKSKITKPVQIGASLDDFDVVEAAPSNAHPFR